MGDGRDEVEAERGEVGIGNAQKNLSRGSAEQVGECHLFSIFRID
jgi:hypothetical protein